GRTVWSTSRWPCCFARLANMMAQDQQRPSIDSGYRGLEGSAPSAVRDNEDEDGPGGECGCRLDGHVNHKDSACGGVTNPPRLADVPSCGEQDGQSDQRQREANRNGSNNQQWKINSGRPQPEGVHHDRDSERYSEQANRQNEQNDVPLEAARSHSSILGWLEHATARSGADRYKQVP